ncbi:helix-turn-helix domain-containing protein [Blautia massiliensis (ex Durand et al. 2017)]|uniref:helix-turn-helix domain-containing protein n=1 Tax=Blautia massiliensis (ex Durand et al. 2017) TaxID=1737424 RepID=UPI0022E59CBE|nr:helix-turn-helix transcriptional regulator [Blautia massiliensis (ex Durand et al. 2017)]
MENRIRQLREGGVTQEILAIELEITQQQLSKYERNIASIKVESLKKMAAYFNVTTDYLLGTSDVKRDVAGAVEMGKTLEEYYDLVELYRGLERCDQEIVLEIIAIIKNANDRKE